MALTPQEKERMDDIVREIQTSKTIEQSIFDKSFFKNNDQILEILVTSVIILVLLFTTITLFFKYLCSKYKKDTLLALGSSIVTIVLSIIVAGISALCLYSLTLITTIFIFSWIFVVIIFLIALIFFMFMFSSFDWDKDKEVIENISIKKEYSNFQRKNDINILGIKDESTSDEIKSSFYKLAKKYQYSDSIKFREVLEAYRRLLDK